MTVTPKPLKTIRSHAGYSRFLFGGELKLGSDDLPAVVRRIPRPGNIPSPYAYSPDWSVYEYRGREVVIAETAHKVYQVFKVEDAQP